MPRSIPRLGSLHLGDCRDSKRVKRMCCSFMLDLGRSGENCWQGESFFARGFGICADTGEAMFPTNRSRKESVKSPCKEGPEC